MCIFCCSSEHFVAYGVLENCNHSFIVIISSSSYVNFKDLCLNFQVRQAVIWLYA